MVRVMDGMCPYCGSDRTQVVNTHEPLTWHACEDCRAEFATVSDPRHLRLVTRPAFLQRLLRRRAQRALSRRAS
jgi:NMD protein affecting ribosome stability and mRNA decay